MLQFFYNSHKKAQVLLLVKPPNKTANHFTVLPLKFGLFTMP